MDRNFQIIRSCSLRGVSVREGGQTGCAEFIAIPLIIPTLSSDFCRGNTNHTMPACFGCRECGWDGNRGTSQRWQNPFRDIFLGLFFFFASLSFFPLKSLRGVPWRAPRWVSNLLYSCSSWEGPSLLAQQRSCKFSCRKLKCFLLVSVSVFWLPRMVCFDSFGFCT